MTAVAFACNDAATGEPLGVVDQIQLHDVAGLWIDLEGEELSLEILAAPQRVRLGERTFPCDAWRRHVGNRCWDAAEMSESEALALLNYLLERRWTCLEGPAGVFRKFQHGEALALRDLQEEDEFDDDGCLCCGAPVEDDWTGMAYFCAECTNELCPCGSGLCVNCCQCVEEL